MTFELTEEEYALEGFGDMVTKVKDTLIKWLTWFKDKLIEIFKKIKEALGKMVDLFIKQVKTMKQKAKEWYEGIKKKKDTAKESFEPVQEAATLEELSKESVPAKVMDGFEHANFKEGLFEYIDPVVNNIYKAALNYDEKLLSDADRQVDKFENMAYYRSQVLGNNQLDSTLKYDEAYSERMLKTAKRVSTTMSDMYSGKFTNYIGQLNNKIKSDQSVDKPRANFIQKAIGKLTKLCTFFKDGMSMILQSYCYTVMNCARKRERYMLMKMGMDAGERIMS